MLNKGLVTWRIETMGALISGAIDLPKTILIKQYLYRRREHEVFGRECLT